MIGAFVNHPFVANVRDENVPGCWPFLATLSFQKDHLFIVCIDENDAIVGQLHYYYKLMEIKNELPDIVTKNYFYKLNYSEIRFVMRNRKELTICGTRKDVHLRINQDKIFDVALGTLISKKPVNSKLIQMMIKDKGDKTTEVCFGNRSVPQDSRKKLIPKLDTTNENGRVWQRVTVEMMDDYSMGRVDYYNYIVDMNLKGKTASVFWLCTLYQGFCGSQLIEQGTDFIIRQELRLSMELIFQKVQCELNMSPKQFALGQVVLEKRLHIDQAPIDSTTKVVELKRFNSKLLKESVVNEIEAVVSEVKRTMAGKVKGLVQLFNKNN